MCQEMIFTGFFWVKLARNLVSFEIAKALCHVIIDIGVDCNLTSFINSDIHYGGY